ncbi:MAG TPA: hypothetical protein VMU95_24015 [Trebonia sp.]|nr:hypothetical protein [Trebonia sp.]
MKGTIAALAGIACVALPALAAGPAEAATHATASPDTAYFDAINKGTTLWPGDYIYVYPTGGDGSLTQLIMQTDGNLVQYGDNRTVVCFASNTYGHAGAYATYQSNGALIVFSETGTPLWSSGTAGKGGTTVSMNEDNGSLWVGVTPIGDDPCY